MYHLTFLGTSAGIPTKQRNVTALAIECVNPYLAGDKQQSKYNRPWLLIDCGEATQHQLLHTKLSVHQLAAICITHVHGDHCYGLPGLLASLAMSGRKTKLTIIAPKAIGQLLDTLTLTTELYFTYPIEFVAIEDILAGKSSSEAVSGCQVHFNFSPSHQLTVEIIPLSHRVASHAFVLTQQLKMDKLNTDKLNQAGIAAGESWGRLQRGEDVTLADGQVIRSQDYVDSLSKTTKMIVAGDNDSPELLTKAAADATLLVHEATYTDAVLNKIQTKAESNSSAIDPMHSTAGQVARFAALTGVSNLILTHFSARYQLFDDPASDTANMADIRLEAEQYYQGQLWLAKDFAQFEVGDIVKPIA
ncbi:MBL fold metallo-hydrolase [Psychrobacter pygoscelis]|uniref:MBL fold metallo-hydrolase n=1 Tax=Psychrobacter pygoscelis TaxID=2488563 RepID=UPI00103B777F|nr:MBL fold metallo-hydrolase [Psychrobacter pygoscelis]